MFLIMQRRSCQMTTLLWMIVGGVYLSYLAGIATGILAVYLPITYKQTVIPIAQQDSHNEEG